VCLFRQDGRNGCCFRAVIAVVVDSASPRVSGVLGGLQATVACWIEVDFVEFSLIVGSGMVALY